MMPTAPAFTSTQPARPTEPAGGFRPVDQRLRRLAVISAVMYAGYLVWTLVDLLRPSDAGYRGTLAIFDGDVSVMLRVIFWSVVAAAPTAVALWLAGGKANPRLRGLAICLLQVPWAIAASWQIARAPLGFVLCLPMGAVAVYLLRKLSVFRRLPLQPALVAAGMGLLAFGYGIAMRSSMQAWLPSFFSDDDLGTADLARYSPGITALLTALVDEGASICAILAMIVIGRRWIDNVSSALVVGALVGLGFNVGESAGYIAAGGKGTGLFQLLMHSVLGSFGAHTAFSAVAGACIGTAIGRRGGRGLAIACGYLAAVGAHSFAAALTLWYSIALRPAWQLSPWVETLVVAPLLFFIAQGPFIALYLAITRRAALADGLALAWGLPVEVARPEGTLRADEAAALVDLRAHKRIRQRLRKTGGSAAAASFDRRSQALYRLGLQHFNRRLGRLGPQAPTDQELRTLATTERVTAGRVVSWTG